MHAPTISGPTLTTSEADKHLFVRFFMKPREDKEASAREGRKIFKDVEHIEIRNPGSRNGGSAGPVQEEHKIRFPEHYRRFKERISEEDILEGTPLAEWPLITRSMVEELSFYHVKTVEQLANMADAQTAKFMGGMGIKQKAKEWLQEIAEKKPFLEIKQELKEKDIEIEELKASLARVLEIMEGVESDDEKELNESQKRTRAKRALKEAKKKVGE